MKLRYRLQSTLLALALAGGGPAIAQSIQVGIYPDPSGKGVCKLESGVRDTLYVVVTSDETVQLSALRFAAPLPECAAANLTVIDLAFYPVTLGDTQKGISIGFGICETTPIVAMALFVFPNGPEFPLGCEIAVVADPNEESGEVVVSDCDFRKVPVEGRSIVLNGCSTNLRAPVAAYPADGADEIPIDADLRWRSQLPVVCNALPGCFLSNDVYFGTDPTPPLVTSDAVVPSWDPGLLRPRTTYYWRVVAKTNFSSTSSAVWSFTTGAAVASEGSTWQEIESLFRDDEDQKQD